MNNIQIESKTENDTLPICRKYREELVSRYHVVEMITLEYFTAKQSFENKESISGKAFLHLLQCPKCIQWFHEIVPKNVLQRQKRLSEYCCSGMFCAVEENKDRKEIKIEFTMYRGEDPCWMVNGKYNFISYCPWCGMKLPEKPF